MDIGPLTKALDLYPAARRYLDPPARLAFAKAAPISRDELERRLARAILLIDRAYLATLENMGVNVPFDFWTTYEADLRKQIAAPLRQYIEQSFTSYSDYVDFIDKTGAVSDIDTLMTRAITDSARGISETTRRNLQALISEGIPQDEIIERIALRFGAGHAEQIAITETTRAESYFSEALQTRLSEQGVTSNIRWVTAEDEKVCPICAPLDNKVKKDGGWITVKYGLISGPPAHPNCILPGNLVMAPDAIGASQAFYDGPAIEFTFDSGSVITVTENHPILTPSGWLAAKFITEGKYALGTKKIDGIMQSIYPEYYDVPSAIEEVFSALKEASKMPTTSMEISPVDFHGDGRNITGYVDIVGTDRLLWSKRIDAFRQVSEQDAFGSGNVAREILGNLSAAGEFIVRDNPTTRSGVSFLNLAQLFGISHSAPFDPLALALVAQNDTVFHDVLSEGLAAHTNLSRDFVQRFAGSITLDKVVNIRNFNFGGHVYDLQCREYELYACNGVIVKNCRCKTVVELTK